MSDLLMKGYMLPEGWSLEKVSNLANVRYGKAKPATLGSIPVVGSSGIYSSTGSSLVDYPTLVIGRKGTAGAVWFMQEPCWPSDTTFYLEWKGNNFEPEYIALYMNLYPLSGEHARTTLPSLQKPDLENYMLTLPPLAEQRAIAHTLRTVQAARAARQREAALERERKAALMQRLFTQGTRGEPTKTTEIGEVPVSWEVVPFSELVHIVQGQVDPRTEPYSDMPHVGPENIGQGTGQLSSVRTNHELKIISGNYYFTTKHVLYSKIRPYLNKVALPDFEGTCSADMYPLQPRQNRLTREFLFYWLLSEQFKTQATAFQNRTGIPKINRDQLNSIPLPEPPLTEQRTIAEILRACDTKIAALEREAAAHDELFKALLEELMTGRVRVPGANNH